MCTSVIDGNKMFTKTSTVLGKPDVLAFYLYQYQFFPYVFHVLWYPQFFPTTHDFYLLPTTRDPRHLAATLNVSLK